MLNLSACAKIYDLQAGTVHAIYNLRAVLLFRPRIIQHGIRGDKMGWGSFLRKIFRPITKLFVPDTPKMPAPAPAPKMPEEAEPATKASDDVKRKKEQGNKRARSNLGSRGTLLTGPRGIMDSSANTKTSLLGGY